MVSFLLLAGADPGIFKRRGHCRELNTCNEQAGGVRQTKPINIYLILKIKNHVKNHCLSRFGRLLFASYENRHIKTLINTLKETTDRAIAKYSLYHRGFV